MLIQNTLHPVLLGGATGVTVHLTIFRPGEWDTKSWSILLTYTLLALGFFGLEEYLESCGPDGVRMVNTYLELKRFWSVQLVSFHIMGLFLSMIIYRVFFHRLREFPGPFLAKLSTLYVTVVLKRKFRLFDEVESLHKQHGDYVRLGPTELSVTDPKAVKALYSSQAKVTKGPFYSLQHPKTSLQSTRDRRDHARRRRVWDHGFTSKALRDYSPRISKYTDQLLQAIEDRAGDYINITQWFNYYSFDVMGDLAFGSSFDMLLNGVDAYYLRSLHSDMKIVGYFSHVVWLFRFFANIPVLNSKHKTFNKWIHARIQDRLKNEPSQPDIFSWVVDEYRQGAKSKNAWSQLHADVNLIVVAGSDTTAATLTNLFYYLAGDRSLVERLQEEIDNASDLSNEGLVSLPLLNAMISETLRLHPPVPSGLQRLTPPEGLHIGDRYIPGNIIVQIPHHTMFRDARAFVNPHKFIPERWTTQPELILDSSVYMPFNIGPYACVGKQLALIEIRRVTVELIRRYNITFATRSSEETFLARSQDAFTLMAGPLDVVFQKREVLSTSH